MIASALRMIRRAASGPCAACASPRSAPFCEPCREASLLRGAAWRASLAGHTLLFCGAYRALPPGAVLSPLGRALRAFKDRGDRHAGRCLLSAFASTISSVDGADLVVCVPSDRDRVRARGFATASWMARSLSRRLRLRMESDALRRLPGLPPQRGLDGHARRLNAARAFALGPRRVAGYTVVLVDDVATTGATLSACARLLREHGARDVLGVVLACADENVVARCRSKTASAGNENTAGLPP